MAATDYSLELGESLLGKELGEAQRYLTCLETADPDLVLLKFTFSFIKHCLIALIKLATH